MLESLKLKDFTAFADEEFHFGEGLNVLVGENGTGKTHILKLAYTCIAVRNQTVREATLPQPSPAYFRMAIAAKLLGVFKPDRLGRLARRDRKGRQRCEVRSAMAGEERPLAFSFNTSSEGEVSVHETPSQWLDKRPAYLPTRELLTVYPGFVSLYETAHLSFEETWRDTAILLGAPLARGPREQPIRDLLGPLEATMGGKVELSESGQFYLNVDGVRMEMHLVAEGLRKLATIARLIATGSLVDKGFLFWDEPEANLNPKIIKQVARTILHLCRSGIQVFIASHSLFLLRELDILLQAREFKEIPKRYAGLRLSDAGVVVQQGDSIDDIGPIDALQEELSQSDRYLEAENA
jgi:hypothetical protein